MPTKVHQLKVVPKAMDIPEVESKCVLRCHLVRYIPWMIMIMETWNVSYHFMTNWANWTYEMPNFLIGVALPGTSLVAWVDQVEQVERKVPVRLHRSGLEVWGSPWFQHVPTISSLWARPGNQDMVGPLRSGTAMIRGSRLLQLSLCRCNFELLAG